MPPASEASGSGGPLGNLPGFLFDPSKNRYFPEPPATSSKKGDKGHKKGQEGAAISERHGQRGQVREDRRIRSEDARPRMLDKRNKRDRGVRREERDEVERYLHEPGVREVHRGRRARFPNLAAGPTSWRSSEAALRRQDLRSSLLRIYTPIAVQDSIHNADLTLIRCLPHGSGAMIGTGHGFAYAAGIEVWTPRQEEMNGQVEESRAVKVTQKGLFMNRWSSPNAAALRDKITGLEIQDDVYIATSLGPTPEIAVAPLPARLTTKKWLEENSWERPLVRRAGNLKDCWDLSAKNKAILLGGNGKLVYSRTFLQPGDENSVFEVHTTQGQSAALCVELLSVNEGLAGLRSSQVSLYDFRQSRQTQAGCMYLGRGNSVYALKALGDSFGAGRTVLASGGNNQLGLWDLRWMNGPSFVEFVGHVNDYRHGLGLAVDASESLLFAAGSDRRIRAWNLRSGQAIDVAGDASGQEQDGPFSKTFPDPVAGIGSTEDGFMHVIHGRQLESFARPDTMLE